jgi:hypothetical protein
MYSLQTDGDRRIVTVIVNTWPIFEWIVSVCFCDTRFMRCKSGT